MLDLIRRDTALSQSQLHCPPCTTAIFRPSGQVIGISRGAVTDQFRQGLRATSQGMFKRLDHQQAGALAHDKTITSTVEWT